MKAGDVFSDLEQDQFAQRLLDAIEADERQWDATLNDPTDTRLKKLVDQALADIREGRTEPLDLKKL